MKRALKRSLSLLLAITIIFGSMYVGLSEVDFGGLFTVKAKAASTSDLTFYLNSDGESYSVTVCDTSASGSLTIPATYNNKPVTSICEHAFGYCVSLTSITIPDSVTSIGVGAFVECTSLASVTIPDGVTNIGDSTFYNCTSLTSIVIPDDVTSIGENAFLFCTSLASITIPDSVTSIGEYAFGACISLASINIPNSVTSIGEYAFGACISLASINIPNSVTSIGEYAFASCTSLTSVTIPDSVTFIGSGAFAGCESLNSIVVDSANEYYSSVNGVLFNKVQTELIQYPAGKTNTTYIIPDSVTNIGNYAFYDCTSLSSITIPDSVTNIGNYAFHDCTSLTSITISDSVTSIGDSAFYNTAYYNDSNNWENGVLYINKHLIDADTSITDAYEIKNSTKTIASSAFYECYNLTSVTIPDSVTSIGGRAFEGCTSLSSITIPDSVTNIGNYAFFECTNLADVYYGGTQADWANIAIGIDNSCLTYATIHYHEHTYSSDWIVDVEPTCTESGSKHNTCSECGKVVTEDVSAGHNYSTEWTIDIEPTCTTEGSKSHHCTVCDSKVDITSIAVLGHNYEVIGVLDNHPHKITSKCSVCLSTKTEPSVESACVECNFTITAIDANSYKLVSYIGTETNVVIPATYNGRAITTVGNSCFKGNTTIKSVEIADGVTAIGSLVFMNCSSLEKVVIPSSVTSIGANAFYGFTGAIYCKEGSYAQEYAIANNIKYVVEKDPPIVQTDNTEIDYDNFIIRTSVQSADDIAEILGLSENALVIATASYVCGNLELLGTGTIVTVFDGDEYIGDFTLVVEGDTNGDSVCDALDAMHVGLASNGHRTLDGAYALAADSNADEIIDANDYQVIVNRAVS